MHSLKATTLSLESIEQYRNSCIGRGLSRNTVKAYTADLRLFLNATGMEILEMEEIENLGRYWLNLERETISPSTLNRRLVSLRSFAGFLGEKEFLADYVTPKPSRSIPHPIKEGKEGLLRMVDACRNHEQVALIGLGGFLGLRIGESRSVRPEHFNLDQMLLFVRGKGDKVRYVPISDEAFNIICPALVIATSESRNLVKYADRSARMAITTIGQRAGLSREVASHDLRATFATEAFAKCENIRIVQELLGHGSVSTTEIYTGIRDRELKDAVNF